MSPQRATTFISATYLAHPDTARLGRIVLDPLDPEKPFCDLFPDQLELFHSSKFAISVSSRIDVTSTYNSERKKSLHEALLQLFSRHFRKEVALGGEVQRYQLENPHIVFRRACGETFVQDWLRENVIKPKLNGYMVVGYHTIGSEAVWGVQYRKVVCKLTHWSPEVQLELQDNQWKMPWSVRGQDNTVQKVAEADLGDAAEPDPEDLDDEDEEAPESYFISGVPEEEFILFHDHEDEDSPADVPVQGGGKRKRSLDCGTGEFDVSDISRTKRVKDVHE